MLDRAPITGPRSPRLGMIGAVVFGVLVAVVAFAFSYDHETEQIEDGLQADVDQRLVLVERKLNDALHVLRMTRALWASSVDVFEDEFETFTENIRDDETPVEMLAWAPRTADDRYLLDYVALAPDAKDFDLAGVPGLLPLLEAAAREDVPCTVTKGLDALVSKPVPAFLTALPVQPKQGFVVGLFRMDRVLDLALKSLPATGVSIAIEHVDANEDRTLIAAYPPEADGPNDNLQKEKFVGSWRITATAEPGYVQSHRDPLPWTLGATGLLLGALLLLLLHVHFTRTAALARTNAVLRQQMDERARMQESLLQTQKLESLGILAGGIAHDFNNLLTGILGNAEIALFKTAADDPMRRPLDQVVAAARRAAELTRQLLAYSGNASVERKPVDLGKLVDELRPLLETAIPKKVALHVDLGADLPAVEADSTQIQQLLMNLVINGAEACMGESGSVAVRTERLAAEGHGDLPEEVTTAGGDWLCLSVEDDGCGMDDATVQRIFEPFFTTKFTGRGLGLAGALGIVRSHDGHIDVRSTPGEGTLFRVLLPATTRKPGPPPGNGTGAQLSGHGGILVVDDEQLVLDVASTVLEAYGYKVFTADNAHKGLESFVANHAEIDVAILDLTMPDMSGPELLHAMRAHDPGIKAILSSGYHEADVGSLLQELGNVTFVQKPYRPRDLALRVRETLGARQQV